MEEVGVEFVFVSVLGRRQRCPIGRSLDVIYSRLFTPHTGARVRTHLA